MTKKYILKNLGCANCAAKMERKIAKLKGVNEVNINFLNGRMEIDLDEERLDEINQEFRKAILKIERQVEIQEC